MASGFTSPSSDGAKPRIMGYDIQEDGSAVNGGVFFDAEPLKGSGRPRFV
jgi:hypothetical protein